MSDASFAAYARSPQFIYLTDSIASAVMGIALVAFAGPVADLAGWAAASGFLLAVGAFLLSWSLFNYALGTAVRPSRSAILANLAGDGAWVALSVLLLVMNWDRLNVLGQLLLIGQAVFVAGVFAVKLRGAKALRQ